MVRLTVDGINVEVPKGTKLIDAAAAAGINIPTLCYLKDLNEIGACRVCVVEVEGNESLVTSCNNVVEDGMVIYTNSPKVREARKINVELILSQHDSQCTTCVRSGNCELQTISNNLGIVELPFERKIKKRSWNKAFPLIKDYTKCIKCMRCVQVCEKIQNVSIWDVSNTGARTEVDVSLNRKIEESDCALCGQCITHCPVGALRERDDVDKVFDALADPDKITVIQIAPAVRAAWGETLGLDREKATVKRLVSALRKMGFDYIFDTTFSADLTIMEEGSEFIEKLKDKENNKFPMYTSCCPGWVRYAKSHYPEIVDQLSTAKSPQQMFGAVAKTYYADILGVDPDKIFSISVMPCIAKKHECDIPTINDSKAEKDVDVVLTTREIDRMIRSEHINVHMLKEEGFDMPLGIGTGAGVIFGATGGVMEAALRTAHFLVTGKNPKPDAFKEVRGMDGWKESTIDIAGIKVRTAVVSGLGNADKLIKAIEAGTVEYDFVEVMACPGGCSGGGGQPIADKEEKYTEKRVDKLYELDQMSEIRFSHENPSITKIYEEYLEAPLSHKAHKLLHTDHDSWDMPLSPFMEDEV